jgi:DNA-binding PadR family transcriptional regulator
VGAKVATRIKSQAAHLRRLSVVFAVEIRLKIVTELYMREMSPKEFYEEFGGGSLSRVTKNFEKLEDHGWLRYIRSEGPGGSRRGGVEHYYRATELAFFDAETWALMPYSIRVSSSWNIFNQIAQRLREAMEAVRLEESRSRDLACTSLLLDQLGWERLIAAIDALFVSNFEEQDDARLRVSHSGEPLIRADVFLVAFESPMRRGGRVGPDLAEAKKEPLIPFPERLSPVLADDMCLQIIAELNLREMSVTQYHQEFGGDASVGGVRRRFKRLEKVGWLKKVREETGGKRRGATEHFYRATGPALVDSCPWDEAPDSLRGTSSWRTFERFSELIKEAMRAGTFDARKDRYATWSLLSLDQRGWEKVIAGIEALLAFAVEEQERASDRMEESKEEPLKMTVVTAALESPKDPVKAP